MISGILLVLVGISGIIASMVLGQVRIYLILIIPIFVMDGFMPLISVIMLIAGSFMLFFSRIGPLSPQNESSLTSIHNSKGRVEGGGVIFIGPIPIIFGSKRFKEGLPRVIFFWILGIAILIFILATIVLWSIIY